MNIRRLVLLFSLLITHFSFAFSQTALEMDTMLTSKAVNAAQAARFVLGTADLLPPGVAGADAEKAAYDLALSKGWINSDSTESITMKDTAFLIMQAFDLKGGVMYSLFSNPRYAYREMVYQRIITGKTDQNMKVSGTKLLLIFDRVGN